ncbi:MAG: hypothetical protein Q7R70_05700 [Candidatus Diapherotrites archaeon]|nr:hypothetical protein [Candidatus Diapherotrites archaeon]
MRFNSKGQAFDVFKLLIAAVIALAMLAILIPILKINITANDPGKAASDLVKSNYDKYSEYSTSQEVLFNSSASSLNLKSIATQSKNISATQLCIGMGDFEGSEEFSLDGTSGNVVLKYTGTSQKRATIGIICDDAKSLEGDLTNQSITPGTMKCGNGDSEPPSESSETYCILIMKAA